MERQLWGVDFGVGHEILHCFLFTFVRDYSCWCVIVTVEILPHSVMHVFSALLSACLVHFFAPVQQLNSHLHKGTAPNEGNALEFYSTKLNKAGVKALLLTLKWS